MYKNIACTAGACFRQLLLRYKFISVMLIKYEVYIYIYIVSSILEHNDDLININLLFGFTKIMLIHRTILRQMILIEIKLMFR